MTNAGSYDSSETLKINVNHLQIKHKPLIDSYLVSTYNIGNKNLGTIILATIDQYADINIANLVKDFSPDWKLSRKNKLDRFGTVYWGL